MEKKAYGFHEQLHAANQYEQKSLTILASLDYFNGIEHLAAKGTVADGFLPRTGEWVEVKVDFTNFPNHFIEQFSSHDDKTLGGPWQYQEKGARFYLFYYVKTNHLYLFETTALVERIRQWRREKRVTSAHYRLVEQKHGRYKTGGWTIPKKWLDQDCLAFYDGNYWTKIFKSK